MRFLHSFRGFHGGNGMLDVARVDDVVAGLEKAAGLMQSRNKLHLPLPESAIDGEVHPIDAMMVVKAIVGGSSSSKTVSRLRQSSSSEVSLFAFFIALTSPLSFFIFSSLSFS